MKSVIRNHKELLQEEQRLVQLRLIQGEILSLDVQQWKQKLAPLAIGASVAKKLVVPASSHFILNKPLRVAVKRLTKKLLPRRLGWLARWIIPVMVKNYSSHKLGQVTDRVVMGVRDWWHNKRDMSKQAPE